MRPHMRSYEDVRPLLMAVTGSAAVEADARATRSGSSESLSVHPSDARGTQARDGSLSFAHAAHAKGGQMGGGPPGVARGG